MSKHVEKLQKITAWSPHEQQNHSCVTDMQYDDVTRLIECVTKLLTVARERPHNWQKYCEANLSTLAFLLFVSLNLEEVVAHVSMELLLVATECCAEEEGKAKKKKRVVEREKKLNSYLLEGMSDEGLEDFLRHFLLHMNSSKLRWKAHQLTLNMFRYFIKHNIIQVTEALLNYQSLYIFTI